MDKHDFIGKPVERLAREGFHGQKSRAEHLQWCKRRALEYVERGQLHDAWASMASDLNKHPGTAKHAAIELGMMLLIGGHLDTPQKMRDFIEGFN